MKFVPAVATLFCLAMPGSFFNRLAQNKVDLCTAVSSEAWAKLREWAILAGKGWLLLSGSVALASKPLYRGRQRNASQDREGN